MNEATTKPSAAVSTYPIERRRRAPRRPVRRPSPGAARSGRSACRRSVRGRSPAAPSTRTSSPTVAVAKSAHLGEVHVQERHASARCRAPRTRSRGTAGAPAGRGPAADRGGAAGRRSQGESSGPEAPACQSSGTAAARVAPTVGGAGQLGDRVARVLGQPAHEPVRARVGDRVDPGRRRSARSRPRRRRAPATGPASCTCGRSFCSWATRRISRSTSATSTTSLPR